MNISKHREAIESTCIVSANLLFIRLGTGCGSTSLADLRWGAISLVSVNTFLALGFRNFVDRVRS